MQDAASTYPGRFQGSINGGDSDRAGFTFGLRTRSSGRTEGQEFDEFSRSRRGGVRRLQVFAGIAVLLGVMAGRSDGQRAEPRAPEPETTTESARMHRRTAHGRRRKAGREFRFAAIPSRGTSFAARARYGAYSSESDAFLLSAIEVSRRVGCHARDLLAVMMRESGLRADACNRASHAVGLLQFLPSTLGRLGWTGSPNQFRSLSAEEQMPFVERFLSQSSAFGLDSAGRLYQAVFMPGSLRLSGGAVLTNHGRANRGRYARNRSLDFNGDGQITVADLQEAIDRSCRSAEWHQVESRLQELEGGRADHAETARDPDQRREWRTVFPRGSEIEPAGESVSPGSHASPFNRDRREPGDAEQRIDLATTSGLMRGLRAVGFRVDADSLRAAIRGFQWRAGLPTDGAAGPTTRTALAAALTAAGIAVRGAGE